MLSTPVVRALKTQLEDCEVHFCTKKQYLPLLQENPYIDRIHCLDGSLIGLIAALRKEKFHKIIDLHHNLRTAIIKVNLRVRSFSFNKLNLQKWLMVRFKINKLPNLHIVDRYMEALKPLGIKPDQLGLDYFIPAKDEVEKGWLPPSHHNGYVAFAIGAKHHTKKLPVNRIIELCDKINKPVVLLGGQEDFEVGRRVEEFFMPNAHSEAFESQLKDLNKRTSAYNGCGKFSLNQSGSIIKQAQLVFSHDTGMMHIAAALKKEVYSIWGNTIPSFGMYPYKTKFTILENNKISCRPCSKIGFDDCPKGHFKCMNDIVFDFYIP